MTKLFNFVDKYGIRTLVTLIIISTTFLGFVYVSGIKNDIAILDKHISIAFTAHEEVQEAKSQLDIEVYEVILSALEDIIKFEQYIIDQNRINAIPNEQPPVNKVTKPTYEELKAHTVWIEGCSGTAKSKTGLTFPLAEDGQCWGGTGVVIKITDTETFILTNNHVAGKEQDNVRLTIESGTDMVQAEIVKYNDTVDAAVIKVQGKLLDKVAISGIATANIQDPVYLVGNPLGVKYVYSEGVVAGYEDISMLIQVPCIYGNSGSGVFDANGKLVGLVYALEMYRGFLGIPEARITHSLIVDSVSIRVFLKDLGLVE